MQFKIFKKTDFIVQGVSDNSFGSIAGFKKDERSRKFLKSLDYKIDIKNLVWAEQDFSGRVHVCRYGDSGKTVRKVDGLITDIPGQVLAIITADCLPIFLYDKKNNIVGLLHGGAKCLQKGIIERALKKMNFCFESKPQNILVAIGPHIKKCHYSLKKETQRKLEETKFKKYFVFKKNKAYLDLTKLAVDDLIKLGVKKKNIEDSGICTFCSAKKYFSHRKRCKNPDFYKEKYSRFASFIGLKKIKPLTFKNLRKLIEESTKDIKKGKVLVCPTDTVYGLVADASNKRAIDRLFKIKKRNQKKPIPIFVKDIKTAKKFAEINKDQESFLKSVWPGKVTVVLKRKKGSKLYGVDKKTVGLRVPDYGFLKKLLLETNLPLSGTSANVSEKPFSTKIKKIIKQFEKEENKPDIFLDAGELQKNKPSKVIDLTSKKPKILRK